MCSHFYVRSGNVGRFVTDNSSEKMWPLPLHILNPWWSWIHSPVCSMQVLCKAAQEYQLCPWAVNDSCPHDDEKSSHVIEASQNTEIFSFTFQHITWRNQILQSYASGKNENTCLLWFIQCKGHWYHAISEKSRSNLEINILNKQMCAHEIWT